MESGKFIILSEISEDEKRLVENQLEAILASTYFHSAKQMQRFLEYIVKKTLSGEGDSLKQYTIGIEALGLPDDFDSDTNPSVRIMGGRVRNRLWEYYENTDKNQIIIDIPKGTYSSVFNYPKIKKSNLSDDSVETNKAAFTSKGPRLALISFKRQSKMSNRLLQQTAVALAEGFSSFDLFSLIVYNPYVDKSQFHGVGGTLEVDYVLTLVVQELPMKQYELICRLEKTSSKETLWSESYDLNNKIAVVNQDAVIRKIIATIADVHQGKLHLHWARNLLLNKETIPDEFKALSYYRQYYDNFNIKTFKEALSVCEAALVRNPNDIIANILFSDLCRRDFVHAYDCIDSPLQRGIECAERVTHLRQDCNEAHFTLGQLLFSQGDWKRSVTEFDIAMNISNAHAVIEFGCGYYFCLMGKWDEGLLLVKKAINLSNTYPSWYHTPIFLSLYIQEKYQEALVEAQKIVAPCIYGPLARCISYAQLGNIPKAKSEYSELIKMPEMGEDSRKTISRLFCNEKLVEKICNGLEIAIKD